MKEKTEKVMKKDFLKDAVKMIKDAEEVMMIITDKQVLISTREKDTEKEEKTAIMSAIMATLKKLVKDEEISKELLVKSLSVLLKQLEEDEKDDFDEIEDKVDKIEKIFDLLDEI